MLSLSEKTELFTRGYAHFSHINMEQIIIDEMEGVKDKKTYTGILPIRYSSEIYSSSFLKVDQAHYASDQLKNAVTTQEIGLDVADGMNANSVQLWSTSLYFFDAVNDKAFLGIHSDSKYTSFISGDYCSIYMPTADIDFLIVPGLDGLRDVELDSPIVEDINEQIDRIGVGIERVKVKKGEGIIFHSSCLKGIHLDKGKAFVLAAYYRTEKNFFKKNENSFGMLSYIDNFTLSPIVFHRVNDNG